MSLFMKISKNLNLIFKQRNLYFTISVEEIPMILELWKKIQFFSEVQPRESRGYSLLYVPIYNLFKQ